MSSEDDERKPEALYSVLWTLRRVTVEIAQVSVPVTDAVARIDENGVKRISVEMMKMAAIELGKGVNVSWHVEDQTVDLNPMQYPLSHVKTTHTTLEEG